ncbi:COP9 signalosome complex subunit 7 isoform X2 [Vitis vinifera]|uniref:COP9 signalosome complex subunit 7 isoform X2 n=1 Tax=Vitis vinifera TaxID=29760 RepID=UPI0028830FF2|nr:COP9 signalosome complex subunit 7 isoform X2 [Vitis vinifera]
MGAEQRETQAIEQFVKRASDLEGSSLVDLIIQATSHSSLFAFSEILAVPSVVELHGTQYSVYIDLLRLFAHGTWRDYKSHAGFLPELVPDQVLKLKQLSILTLAEKNKVLSYYQLMQELDISNVRELEDFLINECINAGIVRGKLNQLQKCFEVQFAAGRDLRPGTLVSLIQTLTNWLSTSDKMLLTIKEMIDQADRMKELDKEHQKEVEEKIELAKKFLQNKPRIKLGPLEDIDMLYMDEVMSSRELGTHSKRYHISNTLHISWSTNYAHLFTLAQDYTMYFHYMDKEMT